MAETRPNILIVEDDADILRLLRDELEDEGFAIHTATNGAEALELLSQIDPPELILLDLLLPVMDGWQFLREWGALDVSKKVPIIAVSAVAYRGAPGAVAAVPKPINVANLVQIIAQVRSQRLSATGS